MKQISRKLIGIVLLFFFTIPLTAHAGVIDVTVNGMDGFQIEGDSKIWLDLDNLNILGKC